MTLNYTKTEYINRPIFSSVFKWLESESDGGWADFNWDALPEKLDDYDFDKYYGVNPFICWQLIMSGYYERLMLIQKLSFRSANLLFDKIGGDEPEWDRSQR